MLQGVNKKLMAVMICLLFFCWFVNIAVLLTSRPQELMTTGASEDGLFIVGWKHSLRFFPREGRAFSYGTGEYIPIYIEADADTVTVCTLSGPDLVFDRNNRYSMTTEPNPEPNKKARNAYTSFTAGDSYYSCVQTEWRTTFYEKQADGNKIVRYRTSFLPALMKKLQPTTYVIFPVILIVSLVHLLTHMSDEKKSFFDLFK